MNRRRRIEPGPGQESVWDYPRPPRIEPAGEPVRVEHAGRVIAATEDAWRVLETSHPPVYTVPPGDVAEGVLRPNPKRTMCEFKGRAAYWDLVVGERVVEEVAWSYPEPVAGYEAIRDHLCFYPGKVDACRVGDERVEAQEGGFYGGWITGRVVGPFKGAPGTLFW